MQEGSDHTIKTTTRRRAERILILRGELLAISLGIMILGGLLSPFEFQIWLFTFLPVAAILTAISFGLTEWIRRLRGESPLPRWDMQLLGLSLGAAGCAYVAFALILVQMLNGLGTTDVLGLLLLGIATFLIGLIILGMSEAAPNQSLGQFLRKQLLPLPAFSVIAFGLALLFLGIMFTVKATAISAYYFAGVTMTALGLVFFIVGLMIGAWHRTTAGQAPQIQPFREAPRRHVWLGIGALTVVGIVLLGIIFAGGAQLWGNGSCPSWHSEVVADSYHYLVSPGIANAEVSSFVPHQDNGACGTAILAPEMSGWVNFTAQGSTSAAGYVAIYNQTAWTTVLEGGNASPVWCSSWQNEFSCKSTGSLHIWEQPEGLFPYRDTSVLFCVWSQSNATIEEQVTYSWEST